MQTQSLCHHLQAQLTEYYRLVAILESQMNSTSENGESPATPDGGLTLRRLDVWIDDWRLRMRMMSVCVENCKGTNTLYSLPFHIDKMSV
jgi:gamma-tubulin complex component 3